MSDRIPTCPAVMAVCWGVLVGNALDDFGFWGVPILVLSVYAWVAYDRVVLRFDADEPASGREG